MQCATVATTPLTAIRSRRYVTWEPNPLRPPFPTDVSLLRGALHPSDTT